MSAHRSQTLEGTEARADLLHVVVAYEDQTTGRRALDAYKRLIRRLGDQIDFHTDIWKFEALQDPHTRRHAIHSASLADVIMLSAHGQQFLPPQVRDWIDGWPVKQPDQPKALVGLLDAHPHGKDVPSPVVKYLEQAARERRMDFFCFRFRVEGLEAELTPAKVTERANTRTSTLTEILYRTTPVQRWGLNE